MLSNFTSNTTWKLYKNFVDKHLASFDWSWCWTSNLFSLFFSAIFVATMRKCIFFKTWCKTSEQYFSDVFLTHIWPDFCFSKRLGCKNNVRRNWRKLCWQKSTWDYFRTSWTPKNVLSLLWRAWSQQKVRHILWTFWSQKWAWDYFWTFWSQK